MFREAHTNRSRHGAEEKRADMVSPRGAKSQRVDRASRPRHGNEDPASFRASRRGRQTRAVRREEDPPRRAVRTTRLPRPLAALRLNHGFTKSNGKNEINLILPAFRTH